MTATRITTKYEIYQTEIEMDISQAVILIMGLEGPAQNRSRHPSCLPQLQGPIHVRRECQVQFLKEENFLN